MSKTATRMKGYAVHVDMQDLAGGTQTPDRVPEQLLPLLSALSESPDVEYVHVLRNGVQMLAAFAPHDAEAVASMIASMAPGLAAMLRKDPDPRITAEIRRLMNLPNR